MPKEIYVFAAELADFTDIRRTIAIGSTQTLDDLHHMLRAAFAWDDEHLYSFWLKGGFWARNGSEYTHPFHAAQSNPLGPFATGPAPKSADVRLDRLKLGKGQRLAYVQDFGDEWRVTLTLRQITADDGGVYPRLLEQVGNAPPRYPDLDEERTLRDARNSRWLLRNSGVRPGRLRRFGPWARTSWSAIAIRCCCCRRACASGCPTITSRGLSSTPSSAWI